MCGPTCNASDMADWTDRLFRYSGPSSRHRHGSCPGRGPAVDVECGIGRGAATVDGVAPACRM